MDELIFINRPDPNNINYIKVGSVVWLNSGSPPLRIIHVDKQIAYLSWRDGNAIQTIHAPKQCFTPEPTPIEL